MFRCQLCEIVPELKGRGPRTVGPGEQCILVTVESRAAEYPSRPKAHRMRVARKGKLSDDPGGSGFEIVREVRSCARCAADFEAMQAERETFTSV